MSRTDRHRPYWVKEADPLDQRFYWWDQGTPNHGWRKVFWYRDCNCRAWYCCGNHWRKAETRALRHNDQRRIREALKGDLSAWDGRLKPKGS